MRISALSNPNAFDLISYTTLGLPEGQNKRMKNRFWKFCKVIHAQVQDKGFVTLTEVCPVLHK